MESYIPLLAEKNMGSGQILRLCSGPSIARSFQTAAVMDAFYQ